VLGLGSVCPYSHMLCWERFGGYGHT